jgi:putative oxidoreductase
MSVKHGRAGAADWGLLILRVASWAMLFGAHGLPKLRNYAERAGGFADPIGLGSEVGFALVVFSEVVACLLVAIGLMTRAATLPLIGFFLVAALIQHADDPFNRRELPLLYGAVYVLLLLAGPGRLSLDAWIAERRRR